MLNSLHSLLDAVGAGALFGAAALIYRDLPHGPRVVAGREERRLRAVAYRRMAAFIVVGLSLLVGGIK